MRLCFLYKNTYAPYSKWFGTAFHQLDVSDTLKNTVYRALSANSPEEQEDMIVNAQAMVADLHNISNLTDFVDYKIENYFGRNIKVIFADKFAEATVKELKNTAFENAPLIGTLSQIGGLSSFADDKACYAQIARLYSKQ